jgi:tight adherence protein B
VNRLRLKLEAAGLSRFSALQVLVFVLALASVGASWVQLSFGVWGLSLFVFFAVPGIALELLTIWGKQRTSQLIKLWPEIIDTLQSLASSGSGIVDSLEHLATSGHPRVRPAFTGLVRRIDDGIGIEASLDWFKSQFGLAQADRLAELIRIVQTSGGVGYLSSLMSQSAQTRAEIALWGELESKQGWVLGTAKLAIVAPWIIVATLSARDENVAIYNTNQGLTVLLVGLVVSVAAYRMVGMLGHLERPGRVFTK